MLREQKNDISAVAAAADFCNVLNCSPKFKNRCKIKKLIASDEINIIQYLAYTVLFLYLLEEIARVEHTLDAYNICYYELECLSNKYLYVRELGASYARMQIE